MDVAETLCSEINQSGLWHFTDIIPLFFCCKFRAYKMLMASRFPGWSLQTTFAQQVVRICIIFQVYFYLITGFLFLCDLYLYKIPASAMGNGISKRQILHNMDIYHFLSSLFFFFPSSPGRWGEWHVALKEGGVLFLK